MHFAIVVVFLLELWNDEWVIHRPTLKFLSKGITTPLMDKKIYIWFVKKMAFC